ncbi:sulfotransferase family 2 domain-containing protein [Pontibaca methylaminivorans]|uniref:Gamma-glutamyl kinase n=1 Tax=Pontibaca methylaminivorans TaxID=515897 RepID=A0A1R3WKQ5_9RHOB|nr:sulfotransferase family 2 domain-containing protein [Pontibaca methylaminivorans]SIT77996.1 hypothetical protein SAMN05421849_0871 [Pontibaca methylaminivorans]
MLVFFRERLVFLAVPKTGTTAYQRALAGRADMVITDPPELKHAPLYRYNRFFRPMFQKVCNAEMETLAVMREPISWLGSWYRYRRRPFMKGQPNATHGVSFDEFVRAYLETPTPGFANVGSQARFLEPRPNGTAITHLFRYEEPHRLDAFLEERLGVTLALTRENVSPVMELALSPELARACRRHCAPEFELYESISAGGLNSTAGAPSRSTG